MEHYFVISEYECYIATVDAGELKKIKYDMVIFPRNGSPVGQNFLTTCFELGGPNENWEVAENTLNKCFEHNPLAFREFSKELVKGTSGYNLVDKIVSKKNKENKQYIKK